MPLNQLSRINSLSTLTGISASLPPNKIQSKMVDNGFTGGTSTSLTYNSALTVDSILIATANTAIDTPMTFSDNQGNTWNLISSVYSSSVGYRINIAWAYHSGNTAPTVTASWTGNSVFRGMFISEFSGVATSSPVDATTAGKSIGSFAAQTTPTDDALTTTKDNDLVISVIGTSGTTITAGSGFTLVEPVNASSTAMEWGVKTPAGSIAPSFVQSGVQTVVIASAAFKSV